jgi:hypothetical protein
MGRSSVSSRKNARSIDERAGGDMGASYAASRGP